MEFSRPRDLGVGEEGEGVKSEGGEFWMACVAPGKLQGEEVNCPWRK